MIRKRPGDPENIAQPVTEKRRSNSEACVDADCLGVLSRDSKIMRYAPTPAIVSHTRQAVGSTGSFQGV